MTRSQRAALSERFAHSCGYCGVSETSTGARLTVDHFQPVAHEGRDELSNWVYACFACNGFKSDYWPHSATEFSLLHPERDDLSQHLQRQDNGELLGLTLRGVFHIRQLHLNRPELIAQRQKEAEVAEERRLMAEILEEIGSTDTHVAALLRRLRSG